MTTPDPTLAARLTELHNALGLSQAQVGGTGWAKECNALSAALLSAFCADQLITTAEADARVKAAVLAGNEMVKQLDTMMLMLSGETAMTKHSLERALSGALDARNMWTASMSRKD